MKVLVTGGSGFIGSALISLLLKEDHEVVSVDIKEPYFKTENLEFKKLDLLNLDDALSCLKDVDVIFHLAGVVLNVMRKEPYRSSGINVDITRNVLEACRLNSVNKVIFASSFYVYDGINENMIVNEATPLDTLNMELFGASKVFGESLIKEYNRRFKLNYVILRFGSAFGFGKSSNVVQTFAEAGLRGEKIGVWGKGKRRNQYTYVKDIAKGCILAIDKENEIYNLISPEEITTGELAEMLCRKYGFEVVYDTTHKEGPSMPYMSSRKAISKLRWTTTSLEKGIEDMMEERSKSFAKKPLKSSILTST